MVMSHDLFLIFSAPKLSLERSKLKTSYSLHWFAMWSISLQIDKQSLEWAWSRSHDLFKFWEIIDNISEMVQICSNLQSGFYWSKRQRGHMRGDMQITMPAPHHSVFYRPDAFPATQPTASNHWRLYWKSGNILETVLDIHVVTESDTCVWPI